MDAAQQENKKGGPVEHATLGDVLWGDRPGARIAEQEWAALVAAVAQGDQVAPHRLYERAGRLVFTLALRITHDRHGAEEATLDVFRDVLLRARRYDARDETVLGWILNLARARALERLRLLTIASPPGTARGNAAEPGGLLSPSTRLQWRLAHRIGAESAKRSVPPPDPQWVEPAWEVVAPGIACQVLAVDAALHRASMLVRLAAGADYPAHTHAGVEELHLLDGELEIDQRALCPGDYSRAEPGSTDARVWSETGCICALITSPKDLLL